MCVDDRNDIDVSWSQRVDTLGKFVLREIGIDTLNCLKPLQLQQILLISVSIMILAKMHLVSGAFPIWKVLLHTS